MEFPTPVNPGVQESIRECYCDTCGLIASSWFHSNFMLHRDGFTCIWCSFPADHEVWQRREGGAPTKPSGPYRIL
jgi:hypothetical protein